MADYIAHGEDFESVADAIRAKGGTSAPLEWPDGFADAVGAIPQPSGTVSITQNGTHDVSAYAFADVDVSGGGGDDGSFKAVVERTTAKVTLPSDITSIGRYAFHQNGNLTMDSLPSGVTSIGSFAFNGCSNLALKTLPDAVESIGESAFYMASSLALESLPSSLKTIGYQAFTGCHGLKLKSMPNGVTAIGDSAFSSCSGITLDALPSSVTSIGVRSFLQCSGIPSISCDGAVTKLGALAFCGSATYPMSIERASFPNMAVSSLSAAFGNATAASACQRLEFADVGSSMAIAANAFANCYALRTLVLRRSGAICTLANVSAFTNTPMSGYNGLTGTVYVPAALVESYQAATNWSTLYSGGTVAFAPIEGSEYEL